MFVNNETLLLLKIKAAVNIILPKYLTARPKNMYFKILIK